MLVTRHNEVFKDHFYHDFAILKLSVNKVGREAKKLQLRIDELEAELAKTQRTTAEVEDQIVAAVDETLHIQQRVAYLRFCVENFSSWEA